MRPLDHHHGMRQVDRHDEDENARETRGLLAIAFVLALALVASYLVEQLRKEGIIEDCLLAGRVNCDALIGDDNNVQF
jgi:hypothetical protein